MIKKDVKASEFFDSSSRKLMVWQQLNEFCLELIEGNRSEVKVELVQRSVMNDAV